MDERPDPGAEPPADEGGATAFASLRYQAFYAATFAIQMVRGVKMPVDVVAVFCEQHDDVCLELADGTYIGIEVKSSDAPLSSEDVLNALRGFLAREARYGDRYRAYRIATINGFTRYGKRDLPTALEQSRERPPTLEPPLSDLLVRLDPERRHDPAIVLRMLSKVDLDADLAKRRNAEDDLLAEALALTGDARRAAPVAAAVRALAENAIATLTRTVDPAFARLSDDPRGHREALARTARRISAEDVWKAVEAARTPHRRRLRAVTAVAVLAAAGAVGFALGAPDPPHTHVVASTAVTLKVDGAWHRASTDAAAVGALRLAAPVVLAHERDGAVLVSGTLQDARGPSDPIPAALAARWTRHTGPRPNEQGDALVYRATEADGDRQLVVLHAVRDGWLMVLCRARSRSALSACEAAATTAVPPAGTGRSVVPDELVADGLKRSLRAVGRARARARAGLRAEHVQQRVTAATDLYKATTDQAAQLGSIDAGPVGDAALAGVRRALRAEADAALDLAQAGQHHDRAAYRRAAEDLDRAERRLGRWLGRVGYPLLQAT